MKRILAMLLVLVMLVGTLAGCNQDQPQQTQGGNNDPKPTQTAAPTTTEAPSNFNPTGYPIVNEKITLKIMVGANVADPNEMTFIKDMEELTNVHIEWITAPTEGFTDRLGLMWSSGEYPDAVLGGQTSLPDPAPELYQDGAVLAWNELIDQYMPNFKENCADFFPQITYPDGNIYVLPRITANYYAQNNPVTISTKWLENVGMEMPTTIDEFTAVLRAFKEQDANGNGKTDDEIPYSSYSNSWYNAISMITGAFGLPASKTPLVVDGEVIDPNVQDGMKEAVKYLAMLYSEELIDLEIFTQDSNSYGAKAKETPTRIGVTATWRRGTSYGDAVAVEEFIPLPALVGPNGHKGIAGEYSNVQCENVMYITSACEYPEVLARWVDTLYDPFYSYLAGYGALNESVFMAQEEGKWYRKTPAPDGFETLADYVNVAHLQHIPQVWTRDMSTKYIWTDPNETVAFSNYDKPDLDAAYEGAYFQKFPSGKLFTAEMQEELDLLATDIQKYQKETICRWICGQGDVEAEWADYLATLESMDHARYIEIYQQAFDATK